jgi:IS30 family transposase
LEISKKDNWAKFSTFTVAMKKVHLTREQRYQIDALLANKTKQKDIALIVGVSKSTISREIKRNKHKRGYSARLAQEYADERKERFAVVRRFTKSVEKTVREKLEQEQWSPEQIVGWCNKEGIPMVSHERIYQYIREDKKKGGTLYKHCRHRLKHRKRPVGGKKIIIPDKVSIEQRPDIINKKERFGDWEIDTILGKENKGAILTAVERQTGFMLMKKLKKGKNAKALANDIFLMMMPYKNFVHSITSDNGTEFYEHKLIAQKLNAEYYFANPYSSWERGLNEYTNKLIRQYIAKKQLFTKITDNEIMKYQHKINKRPRKNYNFESPTKIFYKKIAFNS